ncbi:MAG: ATP-binding protein [Polyangiaceae bacterium]|jgi:nitrogen fixation/metabolism regulation signal transduction histidine kinase|nr:ATP-binding protein [Polyangiaceae bacterium]
MRLPRRTERRLALIFVMVATLPLVTSIVVARYLTNATLFLFYNPEVVGELERSLAVYSELAQTMKAGLRAKADAIAAQEPLRAAAILRDGPSIQQELDTVFKLYPDVVSVTILAPPRPDPPAPGEDEAPGEAPAEAPPGEQGEPGEVLQVLGHRDRGWPVDERSERRLEVLRPLDRREGAPSLKVIFAAPRSTLDNITKASDFLGEYRLLGREQRSVERWYLNAYAILVGVTIPLAVLLGVLLARQVTRRIEALARATQDVGTGDLTVRVPVEGEDELTHLAVAFNRMLGELDESRARVEFLGRMGTWQEMARRLAHEIKNPLTPIQLAVQECHRRYDGGDRRFQKLLDTTLEIVEEEVGTLRRLVTEFSNFARLPRAELTEADFLQFLEEQREKIALTEAEEELSNQLRGVTLRWNLPTGSTPVAFDALLLHRVLVNLTTNAAQAIRQRTDEGVIQIELTREAQQLCLDVEDSGPGIAPELRERIFDPYFTTKSDGNGLGLAIVKKIIVEHGGTIEAGASALGGARLRIRLPLAGTPASQVALLHSGSQSAPPSTPS